MKQLTIILIAFLLYSCAGKSELVNVNQTLDPTNSGKSTDYPVDSSLNDAKTAFLDILNLAKKRFPSDSASLHDFYCKWLLLNDVEKLNQQVERLKELTSQESVERYNEVNSKLEPLLVRITTANTIDQSQLDSVVKLYSDYDYFLTESLFSQLLSEEDDLAGKCFGIIVKESSKDTSYISALIELDNNIFTNCALGESMYMLVFDAIGNNPIGFLEMFKQREEKQKIVLARYLDFTDAVQVREELLNFYKNIIKNSKNEEHRALAKELMDIVEENNRYR